MSLMIVKAVRDNVSSEYISADWSMTIAPTRMPDGKSKEGVAPDLGLKSICRANLSIATSNFAGADHDINMLIFLTFLPFFRMSGTIIPAKVLRSLPLP